MPGIETLEYYILKVSKRIKSLDIKQEITAFEHILQSTVDEKPGSIESNLTR